MPQNDWVTVLPAYCFRFSDCPAPHPPTTVATYDAYLPRYTRTSRQTEISMNGRQRVWFSLLQINGLSSRSFETRSIGGLGRTCPTTLWGKSVYPGKCCNSSHSSTRPPIFHILTRKRQGYIFVVNECDRDLAESKLLNAGFVRASWSWGTCDPAELATLDDKAKRMHETEIPHWKDLDNNSIRFAFPPGYCIYGNEPVALVLLSFVGLGPPPLGTVGASQGKAEEETEPSQQNVTSQEKALLPHEKQPSEKGVIEDPTFICVAGFLYYPRLPALLESLIRVRLHMPEDTFGRWVSELEVWAIPYLWAQTMAPEDVLDGIEDYKIKAWFNKKTRRFEGGMDRVTTTKRKGRLPYTVRS